MNPEADWFWLHAPEFNSSATTGRWLLLLAIFQTQSLTELLNNPQRYVTLRTQ